MCFIKNMFVSLVVRITLQSATWITPQDEQDANLSVKSHDLTNKFCCISEWPVQVNIPKTIPL